MSQGNDFSSMASVNVNGVRRLMLPLARGKYFPLSQNMHSRIVSTNKRFFGKVLRSNVQKIFIFEEKIYKNPDYLIYFGSIVHFINKTIFWEKFIENILNNCFCEKNKALTTYCNLSSEFFFKFVKVSKFLSQFWKSFRFSWKIFIPGKKW